MTVNLGIGGRTTKLKAEPKRLWVQTLRTCTETRGRTFIRSNYGWDMYGVLCEAYRTYVDSEWRWELRDRGEGEWVFRHPRHGAVIAGIPSEVAAWVREDGGFSGSLMCDGVMLWEYWDLWQMDFKQMAELIEGRM